MDHQNQARMVFMPKKKNIFYLYLLNTYCLLFFTSGCSSLLTKNQVPDSKSKDYKAFRLDEAYPGVWNRIPSKNMEKSLDGQERIDVAYENKTNKAIISLNTVCQGENRHTLDELSQNALRGLPIEGIVTKKEMKIEGEDALENTLHTQLPGESGSMEKVKIRMVIFKKRECLYDFMYVARPIFFDANIEAFERFLKEFHVR